jgi:hypothetical protein
MTTIKEKCDKLTEGTVCTAADIEPDKIECWTREQVLPILQLAITPKGIAF